MTEQRFVNLGFYPHSDYYDDSQWVDSQVQGNSGFGYYDNYKYSGKELKHRRYIQPSYARPVATPCDMFQEANVFANMENNYSGVLDHSFNNVPSSLPFYPHSQETFVHSQMTFDTHPPSHNFSAADNPFRGSRYRQDGKCWNNVPAVSSSSAAGRSVSARRVIDPPDGFIYQIQFKRAHRNFVLSPSAPRDILPGDFVKVEADRGEDMGIVLAKCPVESFEEVVPTAGYRGRGFSSGHGERKYLYRVATTEERAALVLKVKDEDKALEIIREKVVERGLPMNVLDAEYQFDRHKLTFYFEADRRIDFRELVSELFSHYKTRIWMQQVDTSSLSLHDAGLELAKATGFLSEREDSISIRSSISLGHDDIICSGSLSDSIDTDNQLEQLSIDTVTWSGNNGSGQEFVHSRSPLWSQFHDLWNKN